LNEKTLPEVIAEIEVSIGGLRLEVEGWRNHTGSASHFMLCELDRLIAMLESIRKTIK
jgi:hypothetical protein